MVNTHQKDDRQLKELLLAKVGNNLNLKISDSKDYNSLVRNQQIHTNINIYMNERIASYIVGCKLINDKEIIE